MGLSEHANISGFSDCSDRCKHGSVKSVVELREEDALFPLLREFSEFRSVA